MYWINLADKYYSIELLSFGDYRNYLFTIENQPFHPPTD